MIEDLEEEIYKTKARIMVLEQNIFYEKEELECLKFDLENMKKIQERKNKTEV